MIFCGEERKSNGARRRDNCFVLYVAAQPA